MRFKFIFLFFLVAAPLIQMIVQKIVLDISMRMKLMCGVLLVWTTMAPVTRNSARKTQQSRKHQTIRKPHPHFMQRSGAKVWCVYLKLNTKKSHWLYI